MSLSAREENATRIKELTERAPQIRSRSAVILAITRNAASVAAIVALAVAVLLVRQQQKSDAEKAKTGQCVNAVLGALADANAADRNAQLALLQTQLAVIKAKAGTPSERYAAYVAAQESRITTLKTAIASAAAHPLGKC